MKKSRVKLKFNLIVICFILCGLIALILLNYNKTQYDVFKIIGLDSKLANNSISVDNNFLLEKSTLDNLNLDFSKLPILTVKTDYTYLIEGEDGVNRGRPLIENDEIQQPIKSVTFLDLPYNQNVDIEIEALFKNCGTLNGNNIDIKIVYSDFFSGSEYTGEDLNQKKLNNSKVLWWTSYGPVQNQNLNNEWYQNGFENINMKVYFYVNGTDKILLETVYCSIYGLSGENGISKEAISSNNASKAYLYKNSKLNYIENVSLGENVYSDLYEGTDVISNLLEKESAITFLYKNVDCININLHSLNSNLSNSYHMNFIPLTPNYEGDALKEISTFEATAGEDIKYTILYQMPKSDEETFRLSNLKFSDELNDNLIYKNLSVYDENENDITNIAGTTTINSNALEYIFNLDYLNSIMCVGQNYKFVIEAKVVDNPTINSISNIATIKENDNTIRTNSANLDLISYVIVRHLDEYGEELDETVKLKGKLFEEYNAEAGGYLYYEIMELPENCSGIFTPEIQEVTYTYIKTVTDFEVYKVWLDDVPTMALSEDETEDFKRPDSINIRLSSNKNEEVEVVEMKDDDTITPTPYGTMSLDMESEISDGVWYYKFENLPRFDENGEEIIYSVSEFDIPEGYFVSSCVNDNEYGIATISNMRQTLLIINKYDYFTNEPLEGAVFSVDQIYGDTVLPVGDYTTDSDGMAIVSYINSGTYRIREIKAPEGYKLSEETFEVEMLPSEPEIILNVPNKPIVKLPEAGGTGTKSIIIIGIVSVIISIFILGKNKKQKSYNFKHRY